MNDVAYMLIGWALGIPIGLAVSAAIVYACDRWDLW